MEFEERKVEGALVVVVRGRLDSYWADHLGARLADVIRRGNHHLQLNLSEISYLSSAGIGIVMQYFKQLRDIDGSLSVVEPSEQVRRILALSGLTDLLAIPNDGKAQADVAQDGSRKVECQDVTYEVYDEAPGAVLGLRTIGDPDLLRGCRFGEKNSTTLPFPESGFSLGLGAIGPNFETCQERFGELLTVGRAGAYLPTDGTNTADYLISTGTTVPDMCLLYGLECRGRYSHLARFDIDADHSAVPISAIAEATLTIAESDAAGVVMVAESDGLMGAALRRSPAVSGDQDAPFSFPEIRDWLTFTPERVFTRSLALVVGVVQRDGTGDLSSMLRPLGGESNVSGHFHAAVFTYGPIQRGRIELQSVATKLFETEKLETILHLLNDDRSIVGVGQSEFSRGACWIGPLSPTEEGR